MEINCIWLTFVTTLGVVKENLAMSDMNNLRLARLLKRYVRDAEVDANETTVEELLDQLLEGDDE